MITFRDRHAEREFCGIAAAIVGSAVVGGVASTVASSSAAGAETKAANQANATVAANQAQVRADLSPYNTAGQSDFAAYNNLVGPNANPAQQEAALQSLPGYQFQQTQGLKAVQNSAAARGLGESGAALKGAAQYATGLADSSWKDYANSLYQGASLGENAAAQTGNYGTQSAIAQGQNTTSAGVAQGNAAIASGNAVSSGIGNLYLYNALSNGKSGGGLFGGGLFGGGSGAGLNSATTNIYDTNALTSG
jgi:hypothetical protein